MDPGWHSISMLNSFRQELYLPWPQAHSQEILLKQYMYSYSVLRHICHDFFHDLCLLLGRCASPGCLYLQLRANNPWVKHFDFRQFYEIKRCTRKHSSKGFQLFWAQMVALIQNLIESAKTHDWKIASAFEGRTAWINRLC